MWCQIGVNADEHFRSSTDSLARLFLRELDLTTLTTHSDPIQITPRHTSLLPRTGVILIGTPQSLWNLARQVSELAAPPIVAGCIPISDLPTADADLPTHNLGTLADLPLLTARLRLTCAVISIPASTVNPDQPSALAKAAGLDVRVIPTFEDLLTTDTKPTPRAVPVQVTDSSQVDLARLIGRTPYDLDRDAVAKVLESKVVLITGAGGSIGSEIARACATFHPSCLVLMERGENALFEVDRQLAERFPRIKRRAVLHDVVDAESTRALLAELRPHAVFHAAAHKHVPLMEDHPAHAITNNLFGTKSIADASVAAGVERFVMISSDKAVNPTSVMGATKRMAEMYIQGLGRRSNAEGRRTRLSMVRFGNVLGSSASVLTIWSQQLAEGGPITVTDRRMTRYFMTIPEAATLVIQSTTLDPVGSSASSVGVFVLDMGKPIAIADLAKRFVLSHGFTPIFPGDTSAANGIPVTFTGSRPGEKIHEELAYAAESLRPTAHPGIRAWSGVGFEPEVAARVDRMVAELSEARFGRDRAQVLSMVRKHVPEMRPPQPAAAQSIHPIVG